MTVKQRSLKNSFSPLCVSNVLQEFEDSMRDLMDKLYCEGLLEKARSLLLLLFYQNRSHRSLSFTMGELLEWVKRMESKLLSNASGEPSYESFSC